MICRRFPRPVVMRVTAPNVYDPWHGMAQADAVIASGTSMAKLRAGPRPDCVEVPNGVDVTRFRELRPSDDVATPDDDRDLRPELCRLTDLARDPVQLVGADPESARLAE